MGEKKSLVGFISWILLLVLVLGGLFFSLGSMLEANPEFVPLDPAIAVIPVFVVVVGIVFLLSFLFGRLTKNHKIKSDVADSLVMQFGGFFVFLVLLDVAMIAFWLIGYTQSFQVTDIANIDPAWVGASGTFNAAITSATGWYHIILHGVFVLLGNKTELVFVVNMAFTALGLLFTYLGGRKLFGNIPVWFLVFGIGLSTASQGSLHRADPTALLFALVTLLIWWIVGLNESSRNPDAKGILSVAILVGMLSGIGVYADGIFLIVAFTGIYLFLQVKDNGEKVGIALSALVPFFVGIVFAFGCLIAANVPAVDTIVDAFPGWVPLPATFVSVSAQLAVVGNDGVSILGLALSLLYVFQFLKSRQDKGTVLILPWICMVACFLLGIPFSEGSTYLYIVGYIWAIAGIGLQLLFVEQDGEESDIPVISKPVKEKKEKPVREKKVKKEKDDTGSSKKEEKLLAKEAKKQAREEAALQKKAALEEKKAALADRIQKDKSGKESKEEKRLRRQQEAMEREAALEERKQQVLREREERKALKQGIPFEQPDNTEIFEDFTTDKKKEAVIVSTEYDDLDNLLFAPVPNTKVETNHVPLDIPLGEEKTPDISQILEMDPLDLPKEPTISKIETPREVPFSIDFLEQDPFAVNLLQEEPVTNNSPKEETLSLESPVDLFTLEQPKVESISIDLPEVEPLSIMDLPEVEPLSMDLPEVEPLSMDLPEVEPVSMDLPKEESVIESEDSVQTMNGEIPVVPIETENKIGSLNKPLKANELPDFADFLEFQEPYYVEDPEEKENLEESDNATVEKVETTQSVVESENFEEEEERDLDFSSEALVFDLNPKDDNEIEVFSADFIEELKSEEEDPIIDIDDIDESLFGDTIPDKKPKQPEPPKQVEETPSEEDISEEIDYDYFEDIGEDFGYEEDNFSDNGSVSNSSEKSTSRESLEEFEFSEDIGDYDYEESASFEEFDSDSLVEEESVNAPESISVGEEMDVDFEDFGMEDAEEVQVLTIDDVPEGIAETMDLPQPNVEHLSFEVTPSKVEVMPMTTLNESQIVEKTVEIEPTVSDVYNTETIIAKPKQRVNISDRIRKSRPMKTFDDF
ncbi:MAG: hypothetical protein MJ134_01010 [Lachnospiraceae bacterium]|nr:hypothetical protein [Lachnospiraceae bacterium]